MRVAVHRTLWGVWDGAAATLPAVLADTRARSYDGIETNPLVLAEVPDAARLLADHQLTLLPRAATFGRDVAAHLGWLARSIDAAQSFDAEHLVVQGGRDSWTDAEADSFFAAALDLETSGGLPLAHETHRGRILFHPWAAARALDRFPPLHLAADYSHWVVVTERLLTHEAAILDRCAERTLHIDGRVGHPQGPQVDDPRAERWADALDAHESWWSAIAAAARRHRRPLLSAVPEFGPDPYRPPGAVPSDDANDWMHVRLRAVLGRPGAVGRS